MVTISYWALAAICLGLGAAAQNTDIYERFASQFDVQRLTSGISAGGII